MNLIRPIEHQDEIFIGEVLAIRVIAVSGYGETQVIDLRNTEGLVDSVVVTSPTEQLLVHLEQLLRRGARIAASIRFGKVEELEKRAYRWKYVPADWWYEELPRDAPPLARVWSAKS